MAKSSFPRKCRNCDGDISHRDKRSFYCHDKCKNEYNYKSKKLSNNELIIQEIRPEMENVNVLNFFLLKTRKKNRCIYCNEIFVKDELWKSKTRDHFIPRILFKGAKRGLKDIFFSSFTVPCCYRCNQLKGDKMPSEFKTFIENSSHERKDTILQNLSMVI